MLEDMLENGTDVSWTWDQEAHGIVSFLNDDKKTARFNFLRDETYVSIGIRGGEVLNNCCYYWEMNFKNINSRGGKFTIGVGTKKTGLKDGYFGVELFGDESWGLATIDLERYALSVTDINNGLHDEGTYGILFNGIDGTLTYYKDRKCLGTAFDKLHYIKEPIYPMIATGQRAEVKVTCMKKKFISLQEQCRAVLVRQFSKGRLDKVTLPKRITNYLSELIYRPVILSKFVTVYDRPDYLPDTEQIDSYRRCPHIYNRKKRIIRRCVIFNKHQLSLFIFDLNVR